MAIHRRLVKDKYVVMKTADRGGEIKLLSMIPKDAPQCIKLIRAEFKDNHSEKKTPPEFFTCTYDPRTKEFVSTRTGQRFSGTFDLETGKYKLYEVETAET